MTQSNIDHAPRLGRKSMPQSPQISISPVDEDADRSGLIGSRVLDTVVEVKGVGVAVCHPIIELSNNGNKRSGKGRSHRSLPSSGGSMSSVSSNEGMVGTRRPPTSLSVLSASSLAEV